MYVLMPVPFGAAEKVFGASFWPFGKVTVWTMSRPFGDVGKPENWNTKFVVRTPRVGIAWIFGAACGGGGGGAVGAGAGGAAVVAAEVGVGATVADRTAVTLAEARGEALEDEVAVSGVTSHAAQTAPARTRATISFGTRSTLRSEGRYRRAVLSALFPCVSGQSVLEHVF